MKKPLILEMKPDADDAAKRWDAYWQNELLDRPLLMIGTGKVGYEYKQYDPYKVKLYGDPAVFVESEVHNMAGGIYGAELMPALWGSVSTDEAASFCGADIIFSEAHGTSWSNHPVEDWRDWLPISIDEQCLAFKRAQEIYRLAAKALKGKGLICHLDSHFNMDLLMGLRGSERLCLDLYDEPELVKEALHQTIPVFERCWRVIKDIADMDNRGYWYGGFCRTPTYTQACDFSAMMSPEMFMDLVVPVMEEEIRIIGGQTFYHWDGPDALRHLDALMGIKGLHTVSYVPSPGHNHVEQLPVYKKVQAAGKGVVVGGTADELKTMHRELNPALTIYNCPAKTEKDIEDWKTWFIDNT